MFLVDFFIHHAFEILTVLWIISVARSLLFWINYIQLKQYRIDRVLADIKSPVFFRLIFSNYRSILIGFYFAWQLLLRTSVSSQIGAFDALLIAIVLFFLIQSLRTTKQLFTHTLQIPTFTMKVWLMFISLFSLELYLVYLYSFWPEQLLIIEILQPIIVLVVFSILYIPNLFLHLQTMKQARELRAKMKRLKVIGVTGSYGKTSVKEILAHILSAKFSVLKTPNHVNVDTGIANLVLNQLTDEHEIFIVEMGAYRVGEIKRICDIVQPQYGVLTAISNQHLELFGSQAALTKTKFELVDAIPNPEQLIANSDSPLLVKEFEARDIQPTYYGTSQTANYSISSIEFDKSGTTFILSDTKISIPLFGSAHAYSALAAISVARQLGLNLKEIQEALTSLPLIERTMEVKNGKQDAILLDDSYNVNTDGVLASINDVNASNYSEKVFVFKELLELGDETDEELKRIIRSAAKVFNHFVLMQSAQRPKIRTLLLEEGIEPEQILHPKDQERFTSLLNEETIILFEGRGTESLLQIALQ
jgi:UDP-N-acetylmuramoyl-tripeptide--D-alanyl-D-alanine ligase